MKFYCEEYSITVFSSWRQQVYFFVALTMKKRSHPKNENGGSKQRKSSVYSKVAEYIPVYFSNNRRNETKRRQTRKQTRRQTTRGDRKLGSNKAQQICVAVFFVALLVIVFVGSTVGLSKCDVGYRNVHQVYNSKSHAHHSPKSK